MSRTLGRGMGAVLTSAAVSLALLPGVASAAAPDATCDAGDVCVFSQDGTQQLTFDQPTGQMPDLFRYTPGPGPTGSWSNGVYRLINNTNVPVQLQDYDTGELLIVGVVAPGQDVSVPDLPLNRADRLLIIEP
jgi:hypothetical protein